MNKLLEIVCDFRFQSQEHVAAWFASLLTPFARFAFVGPTPLFLVDANVRGAGKGLLTQTIAYLVLGRDMAVSSYAEDSEEMRKKITSIALAGDRMILLDNLEGDFGNDALDRALTATRWQDRILGGNHTVDLPLTTTWFATGNNVSIAADTARRIIHIRLDVLSEKPEERSDFRHPDLLAWVRQERPRLVRAALTILRAYVRAGRPKQPVPAYGSFDGWSALVRQAVIWLGLPDPCKTRKELAEKADVTATALAQLLEAWRLYDPGNNGLVLGGLIAELYQIHNPPRDAASCALRAALENLLGVQGREGPSAPALGRKLASLRRRVCGDRYLDYDANTPKRMPARWRVHTLGGGA
jgi:hypothetical protein